MYSAVILCAIGCALASDGWLVWAARAALVGLLAFKAALEERWMVLSHPGYAIDRAKTKRFFPWLF